MTAADCETVPITERDALIVVDPQNDFCPGGSLPVPHGDEVFDVVNAAMSQFDVVMASQDWHPPEHRYFQANGGPWPYHCLQGTDGAEFHPRLDESRIQEVFRKGMDPDLDGYSAFAGTEMAERLHARGVDRVFIAGLATDYCVKATAIESMQHGFDTFVLVDGIRAVEVNPGDGERALCAMREAGARLISSAGLARDRTRSD